ncbi:hypothetical protein EV426DRAFT_585097 [Tirmania nivea]|nr:hypothetical protein EV426DRAFT_585097 [Tirmania nivea]
MFRPIARAFLSTASHRTFSSTSRAQDVARLTICGRISKDPESIETQSGNSFLKYTVATGFGMGEARRTTFWNVSVFDERQKEIVSALAKGYLVHVDADIECKQIPDESGKHHTYINLYQKSINVLIRNRNPVPPAEGVEEEAPAQA